MTEPAPCGGAASRWLALDIGQSGSRVSGDAKPATRLCLGHRSGANLADSILQLLETVACGSPGPQRIAVGITGAYGKVPPAEDVRRRWPHPWRSVPLVLADDCLTAYTGALGDQPGVVVAAGTGVVALGVNSEGRMLRVGGIGPTLGDQGGGYWIGRQALAAAMADQDGRTEETELSQAAATQYGDLSSLPQQVAEHADPIRFIAAFAPDVVAVARKGDTAARKIVTDAGRHLATHALAAARVLGAGCASPMVHCLTGSLRQAGELLTDTYDQALNERAHAHRVEPIGEPLYGAELIATGRVAWPQSPLLSQTS